MNELILIKNLKKIYNKENSKIEVLSDVNLKINNGELISIVGPSGSGKTTLLNIIGSLDTYDEGEYYFNNTNMKSLNENQKNLFRNNRIGFVHQFHYLIPELTTLENTILPLLISGSKINDSSLVG